MGPPPPAYSGNKNALYVLFLSTQFFGQKTRTYSNVQLLDRSDLKLFRCMSIVRYPQAPGVWIANEVPDGPLQPVCLGLWFVSNIQTVLWSHPDNAPGVNSWQSTEGIYGQLPFHLTASSSTHLSW